MRKYPWLVFGFLVLTTINLAAEQPEYSFIISTRPSVDLRLWGEELYGVGGGITVAGTYAMPFFRPLSVGAEIGYHFVPINGSSASEPFSISEITASVIFDIRWVFFSFLDTSLQFGGGYFFALFNEDDPPTGDGFHGFAGLSIGYLISPMFSVDLFCRSSLNLGLDAFMAVGIGLNIRL